jgi:hypothetical protein
MSLEIQSTTPPILLVYLPCYIDYRLAVEQAKRIRQISKDYKRKHKFQIQTMISINGVNLSNDEINEIKAVTDYQIIYPFGISGDINITQGFMHAIRLQVDYLWVLSSNDAVANSFLSTIEENLIQVPELDLLVGCTLSQLGVRRINSVFDLENRDVPFGLISSVVYRTARTARNFDTAVQLNWTGWGQLATIEASCIAQKGLSVSFVEEDSLYKRSIRGLSDATEESQRIRNGYAHSFFGMPIVICTLHSENSIKQRAILDAWIRSNWHLVNYFLKSDFQLWSSHMASNQIWLRRYAFSAVRKASPIYRTLFTLSRFVNIEKYRQIRLAQVLLSPNRGVK